MFFIKHKFFKLFIFLITVFLISGYGYSGDLPELGKTTKPAEVEAPPSKQVVPPKNNGEYEYSSAKIFFPRIYSNYNIDKYSEYLQDIKQVEPILVSLKQVIKSNNPDKLQQFSAKVNVFNLYIENLKSKYSNKPQKNYESYKQLVLLDKHLTESARYQRVADKYRKNERGSLFDKLEDETYMRKKIDTSSKSLDAVLYLIQTAN